MMIVFFIIFIIKHKPLQLKTDYNNNIRYSFDINNIQENLSRDDNVQTLSCRAMTALVMLPSSVQCCQLFSMESR